MALFKHFRGNRASLAQQPVTDGYAYFCVDDGTFHIDFKDKDGVLKRKQINAKDAEMLNGHSADDFLLEVDIDRVLAQAKESGEFDGEDGISVTHTWNGTRLVVTSASGTSSTDLKGEKGDQGVSGVYVGSGDMPEGFNIQIDPSGEASIPGGVTSWNDLTDKPFGTERIDSPIVIDDLDELESKYILNQLWYKTNISLSFTESLVGARILAFAPGLDKTEEGAFEDNTQELSTTLKQLGIEVPEGFVSLYYAMMHTADYGGQEDFAGGYLLMVPSDVPQLPKGVWYTRTSWSYPHTLTIPDAWYNNITTIDEKYIPDTIARVENIPSVDGLATEEFVLNKVNNVVENSGKGIVDVLELPAEDINTSCFYRIENVYFTFNGIDQRENGHQCIGVNSLPEQGMPVMDSSASHITAYYNKQDQAAYGYVTEQIGGSFGVPAGWYPLDILATNFGVKYGGIITNISQDPHDSTFYILIDKEYYVYDNTWQKVVFIREEESIINISWDGQVEDRFILDMSGLDMYGTYCVKISDEVYSTEQLLNGTVTTNGFNFAKGKIIEIDAEFVPGALAHPCFVVVYDQDLVNSALGLPDGYITNGLYFVRTLSDEGESSYTSSLVGPSSVTKIDMNYIEFGDYWYAFERFNEMLKDDAILLTYPASYDEQSKQNARNNIDVYGRQEVDLKISEFHSSIETLTRQLINEALGVIENGTY